MAQVTLTEADIDILLEAMTVWERKNSQHAFGAELIGMMIGSKDGDREKASATFKSGIESAAEEDKKNSEIGILIKAKLIGLKRDAQSRYDRAVEAGEVPTL